MILFCEFNPILNREYRVVDFDKNKINTFSEHSEYASGDMINTLLLIKDLTNESKLITFLGKEIGLDIKNKLIQSGINPITINTKDESLEEIIIRSRSLKTIIRGEYPVITTEEEESLFSIFSEELDRAQIVLISAKGNPNIDDLLYKNLFNLCYKSGTRVLVAPDKITDVIERKPYLMVVDKEDLEEYTKLVIKTQNQVVKASNIIFDQGVGVLIVNSQTSIMVNTKNASYRVDFEDIKYSVDRFDKSKLNGGIALGIERGYNFEMTLKLGVACALVESVVKDRKITMADLKGLMNDINVHVVKEII